MTSHDDTGGDRIEDELAEDVRFIADHIRDGRFRRSLALVAGGASLATGLEVAYEHYRGSYGNRLMYTPVITSLALGGASLWGAFDARAARTVLRGVASLTLLNGVVGFALHVRGIARKPGGWRLPITNIVMGPPLFSPILFCISAYLGLIASFLEREGAPPGTTSGSDASGDLRLVQFLPPLVGRALLSDAQHVREGNFQRSMLVATSTTAFLNGFEAWYSHYKNNYRYRMQWTPVVISPALGLASLCAIGDRRLTKVVVPALSALAALDAGIGFFYHARGVLRRPGGAKQLAYNIVYGPPIFAPLLLGASGMLGGIACLLGRNER